MNTELVSLIGFVCTDNYTTIRSIHIDKLINEIISNEPKYKFYDKLDSMCRFIQFLAVRLETDDLQYISKHRSFETINTTSKPSVTNSTMLNLADLC